MLKKNMKHKILLLSIVAMMLFCAGITIAYISTHTEDIKNSFMPSEVTCEVTDNGKAVKNTGDIAAYIRAEVVVTWQNQNGNVYGVPPREGVDYEITYATETTPSKWFKRGNLDHDGFFYYEEPVPAVSANITDPLIIEYKKSNTEAPDGYSLKVEVIASAIQADGGSKVGNTFAPAVTQAWGVKVVDGKLSAE